MPAFICRTCGTQFPESEQPPGRCPICEDERQYLGWDGQQWITLDELHKDHHNLVKTEETGLTGIATQPAFAIGQRALLVQAASGNILWDCTSLIDEATFSAVHDLGGISAIAISHPHFYSSMVEWSRLFDAPILLHAADRQWVVRPDPCIQYWDGDTYPLGEGISLVRCGGHFPGGSVLHWAAGAQGRGALLTGDIINVSRDRRWVSFMYSFPNLIPLPASAVRRIVSAVESFAFDRIYGGWWNHVVAADAREAVARSAERYIAALSEPAG